MKLEPRLGEKVRKAREAIAVVIPNSLALQRNEERDELMEILTNESKNNKLPDCMLFYHPNSTAQHEFSKLFMRTTNPHDTLAVSPLSTFRENFKAKILEGKHTMYAYVGVLLTAEAVKQVVDELNKMLGNLTYRCETILSTQIDKYIHSKHNERPELPPLYYDIITQRNNKRIRELARSAGFSIFFKLLWEAIRVLDIEENKNLVNSLPNKKVAEFFKMDQEDTSDALRVTDFELVFYPEWVQKVILQNP